LWRAKGSPMTPPATPVPTTAKKEHEHHDNEDQFHNKPPMTKPNRGVLLSSDAGARSASASYKGSPCLRAGVAFAAAPLLSSATNFCAISQCISARPSGHPSSIQILYARCRICSLSSVIAVPV